MDKAEMIRELLAQAEEHVAQGERHLAQQREIIVRLNAHGCDSKPARELLMRFIELQALHVSGRDGLRVELEQLTGPDSPPAA
jgi:hypothetical protein